MAEGIYLVAVRGSGDWCPQLIKGKRQSFAVNQRSAMEMSHKGIS